MRHWISSVNLTVASSVHIMEPHWNPMVEAQAVDRVHRIGQQKDVFITRYLIKDSIEFVGSQRFAQLPALCVELTRALLVCPWCSARQNTAYPTVALFHRGQPKGRRQESGSGRSRWRQSEEYTSVLTFLSRN